MLGTSAMSYPPLNNTPTSLDNTELVVPHALQMGWTESPPFFCAATETARDIIQYYINTKLNLPHHHLEHFLFNNPPFNNNTATTTNSTNTIDVYVDDFIATTNNYSKHNITQMSRAILFGIHSIFPPPKITNHTGGDPVSEKKLKKIRRNLVHKEGNTGLEL